MLKTILLSFLWMTMSSFSQAHDDFEDFTVGKKRSASVLEEDEETGYTPPFKKGTPQSSQEPSLISALNQPAINLFSRPNLSLITDLSLDNQGLTGPIPGEIAYLTNLIILDLSGNHLTGEIPYFIGGLSQLRVLYLNNNDLTGRLPESLGRLESLCSFMVNHNPDLTGSIPDSLQHRPSLDFIAVDHTSMDGDLSTLLSAKISCPKKGSSSKVPVLYLDITSSMWGIIPYGGGAGRSKQPLLTLCDMAQSYIIYSLWSDKSELALNLDGFLDHLSEGEIANRKEIIAEKFKKKAIKAFQYLKFMCPHDTFTQVCGVDVPNTRWEVVFIPLAILSCQRHMTMQGGRAYPTMEVTLTLLSLPQEERDESNPGVVQVQCPREGGETMESIQAIYYDFLIYVTKKWRSVLQSALQNTFEDLMKRYHHSFHQD